MPRWNRVAIIGVGLIGGSIGLALRERGLAGRVVGVGRRAATLETAQERGAIDKGVTDLASGVSEAELVVVCTPIEQIAPKVVEIAALAPTGALLTDAGSTKEGIVAELEAAASDSVSRLGRELFFLGSHPLAGSEKCGPEHARGDLFVDRTVVITPTADSRWEDIAALEEFWGSLGAKVVSMTPSEHDAAMAATSHLPHLMASVLAAATPPNLLPLTASGWADTTRIAAGEADLWRQIFFANRGHTLRALDNFEKVLAAFRAALASGDERQISALLEQGKAIRDTLGS